MNAAAGETVSVVMACYAGDNREDLKEAVDSILGQTLQPHELVIVVDGPVSAGIMSYLDDLATVNSIVMLCKLEENSGTAFARNHGMSASSGDYIAIMDSDDISCPDRLETQLRAIREHQVDAVWSWQDEFYSGSLEHAGVKQCPENHDEILKSLKWRNLLPDPATFIKRSCFESSGGYRGWGVFGIDYVFFWNMALAGFRFYCIQRSLIRVRVSMTQRRRRGGLSLFKQDYALRKWMYSRGILKLHECVWMLAVTLGFRLIPNGLRDFVYRQLLRK